MNRSTLILVLIVTVLFLVACTDIVPHQTTSPTMPWSPPEDPPQIPDLTVPWKPTESPHQVSNPTTPLFPGQAPPQPIGFSDFETAISFLQNPDYSSYREDRQAAYQHMVDDFRSDGYLLHASHETATLYRGHGNIYLYPDVTSEDIGISYWFDLGGETYQVLLYNTREGSEYTIDLETQDFTDYLVVRMGVSENIEYEWIRVNHPVLSELILSTRNHHISAEGMLDATHYIAVTAITDTDAATLKGFIEGLIIEQRPLTK